MVETGNKQKLSSYWVIRVVIVPKTTTPERLLCCKARMADVGSFQDRFRIITSMHDETTSSI